MKLLLHVCGIVLSFFLMTIPVVADMSGTHILIHSQHITEDESTIEDGSGDTYYSYSNGFTFDGNLVIWNTYRLKKVPPKNVSSTLWMMNLTDEQTQILATAPSPEHRYMFDTPFGIADGSVVWSEDFNIYVYDSTFRDAYALTTDGAHVDLSVQRENRDPVIDGDRVVWVKRMPYSSDDDGIVLYNLTSRTLLEFPVGPGRKSSPAMDGSRIVWSDKRKEPEGGDIYLFDFNRNEEISLCAASDIQQHPGISGNNIVWEDFRDGNPAIYLYNLTSGTEHRISENNLMALASMPYLSGNYAVWTEYSVLDKTRDESRRIIVYNILTGERELFLPDTPQKVLWDFHDNRILYSDSDNTSLKDGYVHLFVIDSPVSGSLPTLTATSTGSGNFTNPTENTQAPVPTRAAPVSVVPLAVASLMLSALVWHQSNRRIP
jgi:beta propeller repeat protein